MKLIRIIWLWICCGVLATATAAAATVAPAAQEQDGLLPANQFVQQMVDKVFNIVQTDPKVRQGDVATIKKIVDEQFMPFVDFQRITAASIGPKWRSATAQQRQALVDAFKDVLINTYAGSVKLIGNQKVKVFPLRTGAEKLDSVTVKSQIIGEDKKVIDVNYRLRRNGDKWMVYDVNVAGVWFVETYRQQFTPIINKNGIDGLIKELRSKKKLNQDKLDGTHS